MLQHYAGAFSDRLFQTLGMHFTQVRYCNMVVSPNPVVSDEGVVAQTEGRSELSGSEALQTYTVSFPTDSFRQNIEDYLAAELGRISASTATPEQKTTQTSVANKVYRVEEAIAPYREWEISIDDGVTWSRYRTQGDPKREVVRWTIKLISTGI
jgi:hypothetical protein